MRDEIIIGSRESVLAIKQAEIVRDYICLKHPDREVQILGMKTSGDRILDQPLEKIGGKGLFVKELDILLGEGRTDLSVHSLKDVPMELSAGLPLIAYSGREDPRDVLVLPRNASEIDFSRPIGCSSKRRMIQFQRMYPQARFETIRGNVQTRLKKLDEGQYSATILAAAGLKRLGLEDRISRYFSVEEMIPAAGQGILAVQGRADASYSYLEGFSDRDAEICAMAERAFVRRLGGDCSTPTAAYASIQGETLTLRALYLDENHNRLQEGVQRGTPDNPTLLGEALADQFLSA